MKTTWRHFLRNKTYSITNLLGLTLAITVLIFIYVYVTDELSYDKWIPDHSRVVRLQPTVTAADGQTEWATSEGFVIPQMASTIPGIEAATRIHRLDADLLITKDGTQYSQAGMVGIDPGFFDVFQPKFISGDKKTAMSGKGVVITESVAKKLFNDAPATGAVIQSDWGELLILGVIADVPKTSHLQFNVLVPLWWYWRDADQSRNMYAFYSYIRVKPDVNLASFNAEVIQPWYGRFGYPDKMPDAEREQSIQLAARPVADIHLQSAAEKEFAPNGNAEIVSAFIVAGILLLIIAAINYVNLSSAIAIRRAKEIAVRKTIGASKSRLFIRFVLESFLFTSIAVGAALVIVALLFQSFNSIVGKELSPNVLITKEFVTMLATIWAFVSVVSGIYPASVISAFDPVTTLKANGRPVQTSSPGFLSHGLVVVQFTISAIMIIVSFVISSQVRFIGSRDPGFNKNDVVVLQLPDEAKDNAASIKSELERLPGVSSVARTSVVPGKRVVILVVRVPDIAGTKSTPNHTDDGTREVRVIASDADFIKTLGLHIVQGRDFDGTPSDTTAFILNEAAVKEFNLTDPVGRAFEYTFGVHKKGKIIGIVRDFNFASAHSKIEPVVLQVFPRLYSNICLKINRSASADIIQQIHATWKKNTNAPFNWQYLDVTFDSLHSTEKTASKVLLLFMIISMAIAGLGLFGMVMLFTQQRIKEVGIRKVMGATQGSLMKLLSRKYFLIVVAGNIVAAYPAWFFTRQWLEQFAFRIDLDAAPFIVSLVFSLGLSLISIGWVIYRTTRTNPVSILRYE
jgi:putative ABC transport system permease protein